MTSPHTTRDDALARSERVFRLALEATGSLGYEWNVDTGDVEWFGGIEQALGLEPGRLPRTLAGWQAVIHPDDHDGVMTTMMAAVHARRPFDIDYRVLRADGQVRYWREHGAALDDDGPHTIIVGACMDVTDQQRVEEQLRQSQKLEAVGLLAGGIAHDFNNLLSVIQGYGELLRDEFTHQPSSVELVDEVLHAVRRASTLTRQLLTFSRRQVLKPRVLDVRTVMHDMHGLLQRVIGEDLQLEVCVADDTPNVLADLGQLEQVIMNLAVNARDAMARGGLVELRTGATDGGWMFLEVCDTGVGITPDVQSRMFEPFFTTKPSGRGTGLGLSTVHGIVHQSGGRIVVQSEPGVGSTFRVELPPIAEHAVDTAREAPAPRPVESGRLVLLVEDEPVVAALIRRLLRDLGYEVLVANAVPEALAILAEIPRTVDLVITDMIMPGGSGRDLADQLAVTHPAVPVLFMSGYTADMLDRHGGGLSPHMAFLEKPFTLDTLSRAVRDTIANGPVSPAGRPASTAS